MTNSAGERKLKSKAAERKTTKSKQVIMQTPQGAGIKTYQEPLQTEVRHGNGNWRTGWKSEQEFRPLRSLLCPQIVRQYPSPAPEGNRRSIF